MPATGLAAADAPTAKLPASLNVKDFGAVGDNKTMNTAAFQKALDACNTAGGGEVIVPEGNYLLGSVELHSNTTLRLEKGVFLVESPNLDDYPLIDGKFEGERTKVHRGLLYAENAKNVTIAGPGGISANSVIAQARNPRAPVCVELISCGHATLDGFNIQYDRSVSRDIWCIHPMYCTDLTAKNLYIRSQGANGDGIDVDSCSGVTIENCDISAGDDAISLKSGRGMDAVRTAKPTEKVVIKDSKLMSVNFAAIGIGTEISGGVRNVRIENCTLGGKQNTIFIKSRDGRGGFIEDIHGDNLTVTGWPTPFIGIDLMTKGIAGLEPVTGEVEMWTRVSNLSFSNVKLNDAGYIVQVQAGTGRNATNTATNEPNVGVPPKQPIDGFKLENISGTARHGLDLVNMKNLEITGLTVTGYDGKLFTLSNVTGKGLDEPAAK